MKYFGFIICSFILLSCRSEAKLTAPQDAGPNSEKSGKLTAGHGARQLQMGVTVKINGLSEAEGEDVRRSFQDQLNVFESCLPTSGKREVLKITAKFALQKTGRISNVTVTESWPNDVHTKACFLKQIKRLRLGTRSKNATGNMILATYYGEPQGQESDVIKHE
jgi:hypothetical protein